MNDEHIDDLIGKYLAGETSQEETARVDLWIHQSASNRNYLEQMRSIFERAAGVRDLQAFDTDAAWVKMKGKLQSTSADKTVAMHPAPPPASGGLHFFWKIAAGLLLLAMVGIFAYQFGDKSATIEVAPLVVASKATTVADTLPEGSKVFLNRSSQLTYTYSEKNKQHKVALKGEAYFDIHHEADKKLVVDIDGVFIEDIGTAFSVKAYPESNTIEVIVEEGEVRFFTSTDSGVYLKEQGKAVYNKTTKQFTLDHPDENALAYKTRRFSFDGEELQTVIDQLNAVYDIPVVVDPKIQRCRLTVAFNNEAQDEIIAVISETLGVTAKEEGGKIVLQGKGCEGK